MLLNEMRLNRIEMISFRLMEINRTLHISSFGKVFGIQDDRSITYRFLNVRYYFIVLSFVKFRIGSPTIFLILSQIIGKLTSFLINVLFSSFLRTMTVL